MSDRGFFMRVAQEIIDRQMMRRALALAARGTGLTAPNPMVGCVIANGEAIIGEGWHRGRGWHPIKGLLHAEVEALKQAGTQARGATAYVTLEPCNHQGTTPPCADALINAGVARVMIAMPDPNPVAANGAATLRAAGIHVETGLLCDEAHRLNRAWLHTLEHGKPFVFAKYAASLDGKIATRTGDSQWITGEAARRRAHDLRQEADAIIVGVGTIIADNPALTVRYRQDAANPLRVILDSQARVSPMAKVFHGEGDALLVVTDGAPRERVAALKNAGVDVLVLPGDDKARVDLNFLLRSLHERGLVSVMVEGGAEVLGSFFDAGLIDEVWVFLAPIIIGGGANPFGGLGAQTLAEAMHLDNIAMESLGDDFLIRGQIKKTSDKKEQGAACSQAS